MNTGTTANRVYYRVNKDGRTKPQPKIVATGVENRTKVFLKLYWQDYSMRKKAGDMYWIKTEVLVAIAFADTHLGYATKTKNNVGNVWNTDSWRTWTPKSLQEWINAIAHTLNNKYFNTKQTIGDLSFAWNCTINCSKVYATSNQNWENNVLNTLSNIYRENVNPDFRFRK